MTTSIAPRRTESLLRRAIHQHAQTTTSVACAVGVDVVDMNVLARQLQRAGDRLAARLYTSAERRYCAGEIDRLATTLAGKEAVAKALGTGIRGGVRWTDIQILRESTGAPYVELTGIAASNARSLGVRGIALSLCHEPPAAVAVAVPLSEETASEQ